MKTADFERERFRGYRHTQQIGLSNIISNVEWWSDEQVAVSADPPPPPSHNYVFGKRMEWYFRHEIQYSQRFQVLIENLQVKQKGITIGELDFILHDRLKSRLIHLEMAYKFYLYDETQPEEIARWVGPNRRDTLIRKLNKLRQRQFPLLHTPEAQQALKPFSLPELPVVQALHFKSQLFLPLGNVNTVPPGINPKAISGFWIPFERLQSLSVHRFFIPPKRDWSIDPAVWETWISFDAFCTLVRQEIAQQKSPLCWMREKDGTTAKFFVVWW